MAYFCVQVGSILPDLVDIQHVLVTGSNILRKPSFVFLLRLMPLHVWHAVV